MAWMTRVGALSLLGALPPVMCGCAAPSTPSVFALDYETTQPSGNSPFSGQGPVFSRPDCTEDFGAHVMRVEFMRWQLLRRDDAGAGVVKEAHAHGALLLREIVRRETPWAYVEYLRFLVLLELCKIECPVAVAPDAPPIVQSLLLLRHGDATWSRFAALLRPIAEEDSELALVLIGLVPRRYRTEAATLAEGIETDGAGGSAKRETLQMLRTEY